MPNANRVRMPSYRKHKGTGQAVVTLNGKDHYLGKHGTTASTQAYNRLIAEWLATGGQRVSDAKALTVNEVILAYWRFAEDYYRTSPVELNRIKQAVRPMKELYGATAAADFGPLALKTIRQTMIDRGLARKTINILVGTIKRVIKWATGNELIPASVFHGVQAVDGLRFGRSEAKETEPVKPVAQQFIEAVLPRVSRPVAALIRLQELTGARPGELTVMRGCDLDTAGRIWIYKPQTHKNKHRGHEREVYLGPKAQEIVKPFLRMDLQGYLFSPWAAREERFRELRTRRATRVQPSQTCRRKHKPKKIPGDHYTVNSYRQAITNACAKAGVPAWHPHQLRHNAATGLRKEFGVELARIILGHRTAFTTEIYAEADKVQAMEVIGRVG